MKLLRGRYAKTLGLGPNTMKHLDWLVARMGKGHEGHVIRTMIGAAAGDEACKERIVIWEQMIRLLDEDPGLHIGNLLDATAQESARCVAIQIDQSHQGDG